MQNAQTHIKNELLGLYPDNEISSFSYILIAKITGFNRAEIILNKNTLFSTEQRELLNTFLDKLKCFMPIQYVLGETVFFDLDFKLNDSVLIPRPETEELIEWIVVSNNKLSEIEILDVGTGSGCIAIVLKNMFVNSKVTGFDVSTEALQTAAENARMHGLEVEFVEQDILTVTNQNHIWDIIVSNPPYIPEAEKVEILPNVLEYEPHLALFVPDNDPLLFYRKIAVFAMANLKQRGQLYFEIHRDWGLQIVDMLTALGFVEVQLRKDISGNNRMIKALKI